MRKYQEFTSRWNSTGGCRRETHGYKSSQLSSGKNSPRGSLISIHSPKAPMVKSRPARSHKRFDIDRSLPLRTVKPVLPVRRESGLRRPRPDDPASPARPREPIGKRWMGRCCVRCKHWLGRSVCGYHGISRSWSKRPRQERIIKRQPVRERR